MSQYEEIENIVDKLVKSGQQSLDPAYMTKLKSICKHSNDCLDHTFRILMTHLETEHSEVRYSTYQIINELFTRSHLFRTLLLDNFQSYMNLTIETDFDNPLPPPMAIANKLKLEALCAIRDWHQKYGIAYQKLSRSFDYLKQVVKIDFDDPQPGRPNLARQQRLSRERIVNDTKLDRLKEELHTNLWEVKTCIVEVNNCLELIVPSFSKCDKLELNDDKGTSVLKDLAEIKSETEHLEETKSEHSSQLREVGLPDKGYVLELNLSEISQMKVAQNVDNSALIERAKDMVKSLTRIHSPRVRKWLETAVKCSATSELVKELIDVKKNIQLILDKYYDMEIFNDDDSEDESFDDFEEVPEEETNLCIDQKQDKINSENNSVSKRKDVLIWKPIRDDDDLQDPTSYKYALAQQAKIREKTAEIVKASDTKQRKKIFPSSYKSNQSSHSNSCLLKERAPVVPFGHDLLTWDKEKYKELRENLSLGAPKEYDIGHRFYGGHSASEGQDGVSEAALSSITSRTIEFTGEFEPVLRSCRAPLSNGKLCQRQDRYKCPFHGKIINRDSCGKPINSADQPSTSAANDWQDPSFLRDLEKGLGSNVNLFKKKRKRSTASDNGLTDLKKIKNTSRNRLKQKVLNAGSLKRVSETLNQIDAKRSLDKFGNNFNYALH